MSARTQNSLAPPPHRCVVQAAVEPSLSDRAAVEAADRTWCWKLDPQGGVALCLVERSATTMACEYVRTAVVSLAPALGHLCVVVESAEPERTTLAARAGRVHVGGSCAPTPRIMGRAWWARSSVTW
jgi:hypothetical protein